MAGRLSDYNPSENYLSQITNRNRLYGDLDLRLLINPNTKDVQKYTDIDAIKYSLKNLILSNYYERPFSPFIAGNITALLFETGNRFVVHQLKDSIQDLIRRFERRINLISVDVYDNTDSNEFHISIVFRIGNYDESTQLTLKKYR
jgi:phage baseplate assembly protein W